MLLSRVNGWTSGVLRFMLMDNTSTSGGGLVGLARTETTLKIAVTADVEATATVYSQSAGTIDDITTLGTYAAPAASHCRFKEFDSTNHPGMYEIHLLNSRLAVSNAGYLIVTVQASGFKCSPQSFLIDLGSQVDIRQTGGSAINSTGGIMDVDIAQIGGIAARVTKLGLELDQRATGTVSGTYSNTSTSFECTDITTAAGFSVYQNRAFQFTSGTQAGEISVVLADIVGTSGRRFTCPALPGGAPTAGDTIQFF
jgi:hypothetical protein